jgi:predicted XRE-type DNA-binding protein
MDHQIGSQNIFADIGILNAEEHLIKAQLVIKINTLIQELSLTQIQAAKILGVQQPDVSKMLNGDFKQFSVERLMRFLVSLGQDVDIVVKPHITSSKDPASLRVA